MFLDLSHASLPSTHVNQYRAVSADIINTVSIVLRVWHVGYVIIMFLTQRPLLCKIEIKKRRFLSPGKMSSGHVRPTAIVFLVRLPCASFGNLTAIENTRAFAVSDKLCPTCRCGENVFSFQIPSIRDPLGTGSNWFTFFFLKLFVWKFEKKFKYNF